MLSRLAREGTLSTEPVRILNVDDFQPARYAKSRILRGAGFEVLEAGTGRDALEASGRRPFDLVVLDVNLPDMSGLEVCRLIKAADPGTMVLHTSATFVDLRDRVSGLDNGADGYLVEPLDPAELLSNVTALLRLRRAEQALRQREQELEELVRQKELLLQELNHRVKNNLQIVSSLISLDPALKNRRSDLAERINAIAMLHDLLHRPAASGADLGTYVASLCESAIRSFGAEQRVMLRCDVSAAPLDLDWGVPLGLLVNEILTNALKHAFPGDRKGTILVELRRDRRQYRLTVADDGAGIAPGEPRSGLGLKLIDVFARQLGGQATRESGPGGTRFEIVFDPTKQQLQ